MPEHQATPIHEHRYTYPTVIALPPRWSDRDASVVHPGAASASRTWGDLEVARLPARAAMGASFRSPQGRGAAAR